LAAGLAGECSFWFKQVLYII